MDRLFFIVSHKIRPALKRFEARLARSPDRDLGGLGSGTVPWAKIGRPRAHRSAPGAVRASRPGSRRINRKCGNDPFDGVVIAAPGTETQTI